MTMGIRVRFGVMVATIGILLSSQTPAQTSRPLATTTQAASRETCCIIPIKGGIGKDFTAKAMKVLLDKASDAKPSIILLDLDTPGGVVQDADEIVNLIIARKDV